MEGIRVLNQVVEGLTVHKEVFGVATVEPRESNNFHDLSFIFGCFQIFQAFYSFCTGSDSFWGHKATKKPNFLWKKNVLSGAALRPAFQRSVWYSLMTVNISVL